MNKILNYILKHSVGLLGVVLFFIPFFWFNNNEIDLGGDSARLYFLDPISCIENVSLFGITPASAIGKSIPLFYQTPFIAVLFLIKLLLFNSSYFLNCFYYGFLLSGGFLFFYLSIKEFWNNLGGCSKANAFIKLGWILSSLFFVLSPLVFYELQAALPFNNQLFLYPLFFYLFLKYLGSERYFYLVLYIVVTFIFAINFSVNVFPWFFSYFFFIILFLLIYSLINHKFILYLKGLAVFIIIFLFIQSFQLIPQLNGVFSESDPYNKMLSGELNPGLNYFESIRPFTRVIYNLSNQYQYGISSAYNHSNKGLIYEYGIKYIPVFFIYILIIILAGFLLMKNKSDMKLKKNYFLLLLIFLVLLFLMSVNINAYSIKFYQSLFSIPGFSMFRSFYTKFNFVYIFFYSILLGISLSILGDRIKKTAMFVYPLIFFLIIFNAWPLISGKVSNSKHFNSKEIKRTMNVGSEYFKAIDYIKNKKIDSKQLSFPLSFEEYQVLKGKDHGVYVGPSWIATLAGKNNFVGMGSFAEFSELAMLLFESHESENFRKLMTLLNIGYVIHDSDEYIYENFNHPYTKSLKEIFPDQSGISEFVKSLSFEKQFQIKTFNLYFDNENFLPHLYIPNVALVSKRSIEDLEKIFTNEKWKVGSAVFFANQNIGKESFLSEITNYDKENQVIEFKKINPTKYRVRVHGAKGEFPLVFSESFHEGWKAYLANPENFQSNSNDQISNDQFEDKVKDYKILDGNEEDQASKEELAEFVEKGLVTDLGNGSEKKIKHKKWEDGKEKIDYVEKYSIDFVSKNFQGTIQNDNLPSGNIFETWFRDPIQEENHLTANGYANSWIVDTNEVCKAKSDEVNKENSCIKNPDGTYDFELIVEFWPQRLFYVGLFISLSTVVTCCGYLICDWRKRRKAEKANPMIELN